MGAYFEKLVLLVSVDNNSTSTLKFLSLKQASKIIEKNTFHFVNIYKHKNVQKINANETMI